MKFFLVVAFVAYVFALSEDKIVGGTLASQGQFPYQVSQRRNKRHYCGGSIIDTNTILTAAHCVDGKDSTTLNIVVGSNKLNESGVWYFVSLYTMHPDWNPVLATNDLAVIKVTTPIQFSTYIQPIVVDNSFVPGGPQCVLSGWGLTRYPSLTTPNDLMYFTGKVVDLNRCKESLPSRKYPVLESNICSLAKYGIGACMGDSGGPLVADNKQIGHSIGRTFPNDKIVGGTVASEGQFPYQISHRYNSRHICGGSIIDEYTILTAAHCVYGFNSQQFDVVVGSNQLSFGGIWYSVSRSIMHEQYDSVLSTNDIAVMKVLGPIKFTAYIQPIAVDSSFTPGGVECVHSGFGITSYPGSASNDLLYFEANVVDLNICKDIFQGLNFPVLDSNICAFARYGIGACSAHTFGKTLLKNKIVGGLIAYQGQFPYQISLRYFAQHICGDSIIDQNTNLTAAHCVDGVANTNLGIVVGTNKLDEGGILNTVAQYVIHEKWNPADATNDISVIKMTAPFEFTRDVMPLTIDNRFISAGARCVLSGWGYTSYPGSSPNDLMYFRAQITCLEKCKTEFPGSVYPVIDSNICAFSKYGVGACLGDSGEPLVSNNKQIEITSWVAPCGIGYPDAYTRVSNYYDWIETQQMTL
ncbi:hypothetical protein RN001_015197 [Aquatica leii]|uniref:Peptidase S1 domain-containing protein n=1 Tax=Aquatica leii TaxID=1421715 RepID=A0AAN7QCE0_9COLE|nr:hypothetical protein RN001_015197 [Aquatica leii]